MKKNILVLLAAPLMLLSASCGSRTQQESSGTAGSDKSAADQWGSSYTFSSPEGYYMRAKLNGKDWVAAAMFKSEALHAGHTIDAMGKNEYSSIFFRITKDLQQAGATKKFTPPTYVAQLVVSDPQDIVSAESNTGEVNITRINGRWLEGTFYFSATTKQKDRTMNVTDGSFRVALPQQ